MASKEFSDGRERPANHQGRKQLESNQPVPNFGVEQRGSEPVPDIQDERLTQAIHDIQKGYDPSDRFETQLMLEGLLTRLEQARIVPVVEDPNPYNPELDEEAHERWWEVHPREAETFDRAIDKRNEVLRYLYIGAIIGSGPWNLP